MFKFSNIPKPILYTLPIVFAVTAITGGIMYNNAGNLDNFLAQVSGKPINETRGIWLTDTDSDVLKNANNMDAVVQKLKKQGFNTIYPDVWGKGILFYEGENTSDYLKTTSIFRNPKEYKGDFLLNLSRAGMTTANNMKIVPWFEYGLMVPMNSDIAKKNPEWLLKKADGSNARTAGGVSMGYLNPLRPETKDIFKKMIADLYVNYSIDGLAFDDQLCWPVDFSYDDYTKNTYFNETKQPVPSSGTDAGFLKWKSVKLTQFIKEAIVGGLNDAMKMNRMPGIEAKGIVDPKAPGGKIPFISISQNNYPWSYNNYAQDWPSWLEQGIIDEFTLQNYKMDINAFASTLDNQSKYWDKYKAKIPVTTAVLAGVGSKIPSIDTINDSIKYSRSKGLAGFAIFFYEPLQNTLNKDANNLAKFNAVMSTPAVPVIRKL
jgi:uncharacterized lipoprotein YddW (UPF0748 family)